MSLNDDETRFEQALKGDLPSLDAQARLRKRLLAAGISVGSGLAATSAASAQAASGAGIVAKVASLSWPATLALAAAVATPIVALPVWLAPSKARPVASAPPPVRAVPSVAPVALSAVIAPPSSEPPSPTVTAAVSDGGTPRPAARAVNGGVVTAAHAPEPSATAVSALPAVAAFAAPSSGNSAESARRASTLGAETQLLDRAFAELAAGHRANAAALIAEHERRFPNGLLSQERERARARLAQDSKGE